MKTREVSARTNERWKLGVVLGLVLVSGSALAQQQAPQAQAPATAQPTGRLVRIPVNPSDPVAVINGEIITRQQLSDECVARKGEEILETLIARRLIEQAMRANKMDITPEEIDAEIDRIAMSMAGVTREQWLRTLAKERNISPAQYARDIIYPSLALRKLAEPRVQVTEQDLKDALDAQFGEQLVYRVIMTRSLDHAKQIWAELKENPGGFEHTARNDPRSIDQATRAEGGRPINGPLQRHSYPREVSDQIFQQLVDGDPMDNDPDHKPKDGDLSGPIQVSEEAYILVKREGLIEARKYDPKNPELVKQMKDAILESKIQQHMEAVYTELLRTSAIENKLTGTSKAPNREIEQAASSLPTKDGEVKLMSQRADAKLQEQLKKKVGPEATGPSPVQTKLPAPAGVDPQDVKARQELKKALTPKTGEAAPAPKK
ncbi:MAG TPA: SurA N-terminal domain-containing protein [Isosphaeraceae bacterium]|nr:SurA N-terminal domain-containing protein [Isosphaeraceae bacterium]